MITSACFDLETSDLSADRGIVLCGVIIDSNGRRTVVRTDETNPQWAEGKRSNDKDTVKQLVAALSQYDILAAHNGARFDLPFLRTRLARWRLAPLPDFKIVDPLQIAWRKLRLASNALVRLGDTFGVDEQKTPLALSLWMRATLDGDKAAMNKIVEHCVQDVKVLDAVLDIVKPYVKLFDSRGSAL